MNPSSINSLLLFLMLLFVASKAGFLQHKQDILVYNDLQAGMDLTLHCKSKDDDLGIHVLTYQGNPSSSSSAHTSLGSPYFIAAWNGMERCIGSTFTTIKGISTNVYIACGI
ncbi:hypothetical protein V6N13_005089 [Hibiscus sabdariffa]|uniref:Uncharacterized protein n=2 Tax=Hibiscus sabdariffa TaxID=183260 RepID=A0ABR2C3D0_9ROSI